MSPKPSKTPHADLEPFGGIQLSMYHETPEDAARALGEAYQDPNDARKRGIKELAHRLRPTLPPDKAHRWFLACVNNDRGEKFDGSDWLALLKIGREQGVHMLAHHLMTEAGYEYRALSEEEAERRKRKAYRKWLLDELERTEDE